MSTRETKNINPVTRQKLEASAGYDDYEGVLHDLNESFHISYNLLIAETAQKLGQKATPVIVSFAENLVLIHENQQIAETYIPELYHRLKSISHVSFGIYVTLANNGYRNLDQDNREDLEKKKKLMQEALEILPGESIPPEFLTLQQRTLENALGLVEDVLADGDVDPQRVKVFAQENVPLYLQNASICTRMELENLHKTVMKFLLKVGSKDWKNLYVVVCGGHQARYRQTTLQYFHDLLNENPGVGAQFEERVVYAEHINTLEAALDLLARHIIDQHASNELFDDPYRLQEDLMSDGAEEFIRQLMPD